MTNLCTSLAWLGNARLGIPGRAKKETNSELGQYLQDKCPEAGHSPLGVLGDVFHESETSEPAKIQPNFRDIVDSVPGHRNGSKASCDHFAGGGSCLQFVKDATPVKCNKAKHNKTRYACT